MLMMFAFMDPPITTNFTHNRGLCHCQLAMSSSDTDVWIIHRTV